MLIALPKHGRLMQVDTRPLISPSGSPPRVILVTGSRDWADVRPIRMVLERVQALGATTLVHGAAHGADTIANQEGLRIFGKGNVRPYPADWDLGKVAGILRNKTMLQTERPNWVFAFAEDLSTSKGTKHMVGIALMASYVHVVWHYSHRNKWRRLKPTDQRELPLD